MKIPNSLVVSLLMAGGACALPNVSSAQTTRALFDPLTVIPLNVELDPLDWDIVRADDSFSIMKPAWLNADGDAPILVGIRRKSATPVGNKLSFKVDINEYVDGQLWRGVNKLSLENGDDADVVAEGLAWMMHRFAADAQPAGGTYQPGLAAWITLRINGADHGVLLSVEEVNKQFLRNRKLWKGSETWLYKQDDIGPAEQKEGSGDSPTVQQLQYSPFVTESGGKGKKTTTTSSTLDADTVAGQLTSLIDMDGMLTLGAVNAFSTNPDELFNKGKNFFWADWSATVGRKRHYFPWDLDAVIRSVDGNIYGQTKGQTFTQAEYQRVIIENPQFLAKYNEIMLRLLDCGALGSKLTDFLDQLEPVLTPHLDADPDSKMAGRVAERFDELRSWIIARHANVRSQVIARMPAE
jgi:hypothetical protein